MFKKILIPIDGSESAHKAVVVAKELAEKHGSEVLLLHIESELPIADQHVISKMRSISEREYSKGIFNDARKAFHERKIIIKSLIEVGYPAESIVEVARNEQIDLIVMGHRGLSGLASLVLGSVSREVVNDAPCPVLVVK